MNANLAFVLKFALISYAAVLFFTIGLGLVLSGKNQDYIIKIGIIFVIVAVSLSLSMRSEPLLNRLMISLIWRSVLGNGLRFRKKITRQKSSQTL